MHNKEPFFSIIIPTKNRPKYIFETVQSVLLQNLDDFECIVSDNHNDNQTQDALKELKNNDKLSIIVPPTEMNMIDHWEFATKHAKGKYVLVLADRKILVQGALKHCYLVISNNPEINTFSLRTKVYNDLQNKMGWGTDCSKSEPIETKVLIDSFLYETCSSKNLDNKFPKTLNSFYKNEYAQKVRQVTGRYFNNTGVTTPDYSSFFINMALNQYSYHIDKLIILTQGEHTSNGRLFGKGKVESYMKSLNIEDPYKLVSIKAPIIYNLLVSDFLIIKALFKNNLLDKNIDFDSYFMANISEYLYKKENSDEAFIKNIEKAIKLAIEKEDVKKLFDDYVALLEKNKLEIREIKMPFLKKVFNYISFHYSKWAIVNYFTKVNFSSILDAGGFKNY